MKSGKLIFFQMEDITLYANAIEEYVSKTDKVADTTDKLSCFDDGLHYNITYLAYNLKFDFKRLN